VRMKIVSYI